MKVLVKTKDYSSKIEADSGFDAVKIFFSRVIDGQIPLSKLGIIGTWLRSDGEQVAFRIIPSLYTAKIIDMATYKATIENAGLWTNEKDALEICKTDSWMVD